VRQGDVVQQLDCGLDGFVWETHCMGREKLREAQWETQWKDEHRKATRLVRRHSRALREEIVHVIEHAAQPTLACNTIQ
jgi:hypothetical protein